MKRYIGWFLVVVGGASFVLDIPLLALEGANWMLLVNLFASALWALLGWYLTHPKQDTRAQMVRPGK